MGKDKVAERYGNLRMYERITDDNPMRRPCVFSRLSTTPWVVFGSITILSRLSRSLSSARQTSRTTVQTVWALALMQGLADGYFVLPYTMGNYLGRHGHELAGRPVGQMHQKYEPRSMLLRLHQ